MTRIPVACSLDVAGMTTTGLAWRKLLTTSLIQRAEIPGGVRMVLKKSPQTEAELRRLIELEKSCCAWIHWTLEEGAGIRVDATADQEEGAQLLAEWFLSRDAPAMG